MGIFYRRRLCLFCFLFVLALWITWFLPSSVSFGLGVALLTLLAALGLIFCLRRSHPCPLLTVLLCVACVLAAVAHSFLRIDLPQRRADAYAGERTVEAHVIETRKKTEYSATYVVKLLRIDGEDTDLRAYLTCDFSAELSEGDTVYATALLASNPKDSDGCLLRATLETAEGVSVRRTSALDPLSTLAADSGVWILSNRVRSHLRERLSDSLGSEIGALASAFLLGDRSELPSEINRDFQRAGVSHMMAVSGLHISVLLGSIELLLRKLFLPKKLRCAAVAVCGLIFLFLTGFSLSACRSVLMLFSVYLYYLLQEGNDSLTALFASIALILLIFPRAVTDLGMWMSFLATLGLLTVYPLCEKKLKRSKKKGMVGAALRLLRQGLLIALMTVISNFFLLPVVWIFFGEFSLIAILSNIVLSPVSYLFLLGIPILLLTSAIPLLGEGVAWLVLWLGKGMTESVRLFSQLPYATVSLHYGFCNVLIPLFALSMILLLIVRLRHKRWLILPPAVTVLAFALCLTVVKLLPADPLLRYEIDDRRNEMLTVTDGDDFAVCDLSGGALSNYRAVLETYQASTATEIDAVLLTHYHSGHERGLDLLLRQAVVRTLYLPTPWDAESRSAARALYTLATSQNVKVVLYDGKALLSLTGSVWVQPQIVPAADAHPAVGLIFHGTRASLTYLSSDFPLTEAHLQQSDTLLFGSHGTVPDRAPTVSIPKGSLPERVIYTSRALPQHAELFTQGIAVYVPEETEQAYSATFSLP